jgi:glutamine amidotransferase
MKVVIVDYDLGNLFSVQHACSFVGLETSISAKAAEIVEADALILPGVGAFGDAMHNLNALGLSEPVKKFIQTGKPFLGVCLGMQLLFSESQEFGKHAGLGIIPGAIVKFPERGPEGNKVRVPQIGWNKIRYAKEEAAMKHSPLCHTPDGSYMYFIHSYYAVPDDPSVILTTSNYEQIVYCSSVLKENVFAAQFHPEKSTEAGIAIYREWAKQIK